MTAQGSAATARDGMSLPVKPPPPGLSVVAPCSMAPPPGPSAPGCPTAAASALASLGASSSDQTPGSATGS
eukprot:3398966-Lingulodinium_polyedra.AAC.1